MLLLNGFQIDGMEVLDSHYSDGTVFTVKDLIVYTLAHADELRQFVNLSSVAVDMGNDVSHN